MRRFRSKRGKSLYSKKLMIIPCILFTLFEQSGRRAFIPETASHEQRGFAHRSFFGIKTMCWAPDQAP